MKKNTSGTRSLDRGVSVLCTVADSPSGRLTLAECTDMLGHSKATTQRMLRTLARRDLQAYDGSTAVRLPDSLGGPSDRITPALEPKLISELRKHARAISLELGATPQVLDAMA